VHHFIGRDVARFLEREAATLTRPLQRSEHQRRDRLRDSSMKTLVQPGAAQGFSRPGRLACGRSRE
jgi:hypothetical protein